MDLFLIFNQNFEGFIVPTNLEFKIFNKFYLSTINFLKSLLLKIIYKLLKINIIEFLDKNI